jgi:hypothetical protein
VPLLDPRVTLPCDSILLISKSAPAVSLSLAPTLAIAPAPALALALTLFQLFIFMSLVYDVLWVRMGWSVVGMGDEEGVMTHSTMRCDGVGCVVMLC